MFGLRTTVCCLGLVLILVMVGAGVAEVPGKINYQGRLTDPDTGEPLVGSYDMTFGLYDLSEGGTLLWGEPQTVSVDTTGVFSVILGSVTLITVAFDGPVWLEVGVGGEVLSPRREIVSVPFAFRSAESDHALDADSLGGYASDTYIQQGDTDVVTGDMIVDGPGSGLDADMVDGLHADAFADTGHSHDALADTGHTHDDRYYLQGELNTAGAINDGGNPVAWTKLKDVPSGFADGTDDAGPGDGHSLDAADGSPVDALYVDNAGRVGVGTTSPDTDLDVSGGVRADSIAAGSMGDDGVIEVYAAGSPDPIVWMGGYSIHGGRLQLREDAGAVHTTMEPDVSSGGGGWMSIRRSSNYNGFVVDGNSQGTEEPKVSVLGSGRSAIFDMGVSGNDAVQLPTSSISKYEIKGEAAQNHSSDEYFGSLAGGYNILRQVGFLAPDDGYVLAIGTCETYMLHSGGTLSSAFFGVSQESNSVPFELRYRRLAASTLPNGARQEIVTVQGVFEVSQGLDTIYFLAYEEGGVWSVDNVYLTVVFIPSYCGLIIPTGEEASSVENPAPVPNEGQIAETGVSIAPVTVQDERAEGQPVQSEEARVARLEHEIAVMRTEMEALKQQMAR